MKKKIVAALIGVGLCMASTGVWAKDRESETAIQISPRIGVGTLHIEKEYSIDGKKKDADSAGLGVTLGVVTPIGVLFEAGIVNQGNFSWFGANDTYELTEKSIAIGYQFETERGFRLIPKAGRLRWRLYDKEGALAHPGPELENTYVEYDYFWELGLQKRLGRHTALGLTFRDNNFLFGSAQSIMFTATFDL